MPLRYLLFPLAATCAGLGLSVAVYRATDVSIDLFVLVIVLTAVVSPFLAGPSRSILVASLTSAGFCLGLMATWFWIAHQRNVLWVDAGRASAVGLTLGMATAGLARLWSGEASARFWPGLVSLLGMAWISWPVWLSIPLQGMTLIWSVAIQPLFAVNSAVLDLGNWVGQPAAYQLTSFGQDVLFKMPKSVWPAVMLHGSIAGVTWTAAALLERRRSKRPA